jgi:hypothetical protein
MAATILSGRTVNGSVICVVRRTLMVHNVIIAVVVLIAGVLIGAIAKIRHDKNNDN